MFPTFFRRISPDKTFNFSHSATGERERILLIWERVVGLGWGQIVLWAPVDSALELGTPCRESIGGFVQVYRMDENLTFFADSVGACERILKTPIPLSYTRYWPPPGH